MRRRGGGGRGKEKRRGAHLNSTKETMLPTGKTSPVEYAEDIAQRVKQREKILRRVLNSQVSHFIEAFRRAVKRVNQKYCCGYFRIPHQKLDGVQFHPPIVWDGDGMWFSDIVHRAPFSCQAFLRKSRKLARLGQVSPNMVWEEGITPIVDDITPRLMVFLRTVCETAILYGYDSWLHPLRERAVELEDEDLFKTFLGKCYKKDQLEEADQMVRCVMWMAAVKCVRKFWAASDSLAVDVYFLDLPEDVKNHAMGFMWKGGYYDGRKRERREKRKRVTIHE